MGSPATHMRDMAAYNRWANRRLYAAAASLPDAEYRRPVQAFFTSLHGTLNHLLVADRIWMRRLDGTGEAPTRLNAILHDDLASLRTAREAEDERICSFVAGLTPDDLEGELAYATTSGVPHRQRRWDVLAHFFNHQTHHRGQAHGILSRLGVIDPPSLDLLAMQREKAPA